MITNKINILIPMAGLGSRLKSYQSNLPKPLIKVNNKTILEHSIHSLNLHGQYIFITREYENKEYNNEISQIIKNFDKDAIEIKINYLTLGAADTAILAEQYINNEYPLIITNCDQHTAWSSENFLTFINNESIDGSVVLYKSSNPKNSFANINNNKIISLAEKNVISNDALVGIHYWKQGKDFVSSAKKLIKDYLDKGIKECYIAETYNYLVNDKNIVPYFIDSNSFSPLGTPEDVEIFISKQKEYYTDKPKTIFCDIDGTIIKHVHRFSHVGLDPAISLPGVIEKFNEWDSKGHKIILTTARKESARSVTEKQLNEIGLCWDQLIMGVSSGERILINDKYLQNDNDRAKSINVVTDSGFKNIDWESFGL